ncbi:hypothetical protein ABL78_6226 [Leptomonas seymouri]|uniref:Uncharacterized protein n=1 Tax=Leptomonas seymouri TaxID=5684 RepID=A0A0N1PC40_LEPSE|nr:hypothetical protein ABL78_6226 [Leptomonas seymouri]|eukprot:KPI84733.1 hypothetical protein ABL78_6226 [Leptomonas seymouri]
MLRRCWICRSGHGDFFPTSKAAAHLHQAWVMRREVPRAPGNGHCYAEFCKPQTHSKFQLNTSAVHEVKIISTRRPLEKELHHCVTARPSEAAIEATLVGVNRELNHHRKKTNETPMARANIAAKLSAEHNAKTRDFMAHKRTPLQRSAKYANAIDYPSSQFYIEDRVNQLRKIENPNPSGYVKEYRPWDPKPAPPSPPPPK